MQLGVWRSAESSPSREWGGAQLESNLVQPVATPSPRKVAGHNTGRPLHFKKWGTCSPLHPRIYAGGPLCAVESKQYHCTIHCYAITQSTTVFNNSWQRSSAMLRYASKWLRLARSVRVSAKWNVSQVSVNDRGVAPVCLCQLLSLLPCHDATL